MNRVFTKKVFNFFVKGVDLIIIYSAIFFSFHLFKSSLDSYNENYLAFILISPYIGLAYLIFSHIFELDKPKDFNILGVAYTVTLIIICLAFATMALSYMTRQFAYPRSILSVSSLIQVVLISIWHLYLNKNFLKLNVKKTAVVIGYEKSRAIAYKLLTTNAFSAKVTHICSPLSKNLEHWIDESQIVFVADDVDEKEKREIIKYAIKKNKEIFYEPQNSEILLFNAFLTEIDDTPVLKIKLLGMGSDSSFLKRVLDLILGLLALVVFLLPIIIIIACLKLGGGSVFYKQERVTLGGRRFQIYKFRTMVENAEALSGPTLAQDKDSRITKLGKIMRSSRLDEVPQIINILKGDMSVVGPRPERPFFVEQFEQKIPEYSLRHTVKAGLTGFAQVYGKYNTSVQDKLKYDLFYINSRSFALDLKLIMQTLNILLRKGSTEGVKNFVDIEAHLESLYERD